jgi:hypothetical protein
VRTAERHLLADQLSGHRRQTIVLTIRKAVVDPQILTVNVSSFT